MIKKRREKVVHLFKILFNVKSYYYLIKAVLYYLLSILSRNQTKKKRWRELCFWLKKKAFQHELAIENSNFIQFGYWDSLKIEVWL